jgi:hypothetical protein
MCPRQQAMLLMVMQTTPSAVLNTESFDSLAKETMPKIQEARILAKTIVLQPIAQLRSW